MLEPFRRGEGRKDAKQPQGHCSMSRFHPQHPLTHMSSGPLSSVSILIISAMCGPPVHVRMDTRVLSHLVYGGTDCNPYTQLFAI